MLDAFDFKNSRQFVFSLGGFLSIGDELDLPHTHFTPGSYCRIDQILGQAMGKSRYLATLMYGAYIPPRQERQAKKHPHVKDVDDYVPQTQEEIEEQEEIERNREKVTTAADKFLTGERVDYEGGDFYATQSLSEFGPEVKKVEDPLAEALKVLQKSDPDAESVVLKPEHYLNQISKQSGIKQTQQVVSGGRRSRLNLPDKPPPPQQAQQQVQQPPKQKTPSQFGVMVKGN